MFKNTDKNKMLNVERPVRSVTRSDGAIKIYGWTVDGCLATITMTKAKQNYNIAEIWIDGKPKQIG